MLASEFVGKVFTKFKGKPAVKAPKSGDPKFAMYLSIANDKIADWVDDIDYCWRTVRRVESIEIINRTVTLPVDYARLADSEIYAGNNKLEVIDYLDRKGDIDGVYEDNGLLRLTSDKHDGEHLEFTILFYPPKLTDAQSLVVCDSLNWLIAEVAATVAFNDPQKQDNAPDLAGMADVAYKRMARRARKKPRGSVGRSRTLMQRIGRTW